MRCWLRELTAAVWVVLISCATGCGPAATQGGFDSDNPAAQLYAIRQAGHDRDRAAVPRLVEHLESDDPAVRMMSIRALEDITGERKGYNPYAAIEQRKAAIDRWVEAVRSGQFGTASQ